MNADSTNWFCFSQFFLWQSHRLFRKLPKNLRSFHKHTLLAVLKEFLFWYFLFNNFLFKLLEFVNFCSPIQDFLLPLIFFLKYLFAYSSFHTPSTRQSLPPLSKSPLLPATYFFSAVPNSSSLPPSFLNETPLHIFNPRQ